ncbi:hypothetical protein D3C71_2192190 [compost metagenome]
MPRPTSSSISLSFRPSPKAMDSSRGMPKVSSITWMPSALEPVRGSTSMASSCHRMKRSSGSSAR